MWLRVALFHFTAKTNQPLRKVIGDRLHDLPDAEADEVFVSKAFHRNQQELGPGDFNRTMAAFQSRVGAVSDVDVVLAVARITSMFARIDALTCRSMQACRPGKISNRLDVCRHCHHDSLLAQFSNDFIRSLADRGVVRSWLLHCEQRFVWQ